MDPLLITTQVDLSGAQALSSGIQTAMTSVQGATATTSARLKEMGQDLAQMNASIRIQAESLKDAYLEMGDAAATGSEKAIEQIGAQEQALAETRAAALALKREMADLAADVTSAPSSSGGIAGVGAASAQSALAKANDEAAKSAAVLSASLGRLAQVEGQLQRTAQQSAALQSVVSGYYITSAQMAQVKAVAEQTLNEEAMLSTEAWEDAFRAEVIETEATVAQTAAKEGLTGAIAQATVATEANTAATTGGVGATRSATAGIGLLEGRMMGSNRAAAAFLSTTIGLGPALQAAFPIIGAAALLSVFYEIGKAAIHLIENVVTLRDEVEALGEASSRTAKEAAQANWEWVQSQAELLKAQGKFAESQAFLQANASSKPLHLTLGLSKEQLKELPSGLQDFARSLEQVNTQAGSASKMAEIGVWITKSSAAIKQAEADLKKYREQQAQAEAAPAGGGLAGTTTAGGPAASYAATQAAHAQAVISAETELQNALLNLKHTQESKAAAEDDKVARDKITNSKDAAARVAETAKQEEEATVASLQKQKAAADLYYRTGIIDVQQWAAAMSAADELVAKAHQVYYEKAIAAFRGAGDTQKASALAASQVKTAQDALAKSTEELAHGYEELNKTEEKFHEEALKEVADTKAQEETLKAVSKAVGDWIESNKRLIKSNEDLKSSTQQAGYSDRVNQINETAARMLNSEDYVRAQMKALYEQEYRDTLEHLEKQRSAKQAAMEANQSETVRVKSDIDTGVVSGDAATSARLRLTQLATELNEEQGEYNTAQAAILAATARFHQQMAQLAIQESRESSKAINEFVTSSTQALNSFVVTVTTTTGVVNGRISELRFIGQQFSTMVFQMEKDFLRSILKMVEDTALFQAIQGKIQGTLGSVFAKVGLGPAAHAGGAAAGAGAKTAAETQATVALNAFTLALNGATTATTTSVPVTHAATAAKAAEVPAVTSGTVAHAANTGAVHSSSLAHVAHATHVALSSFAHIFHTGATHVSSTAQIANTATTVSLTSASIGAAVALTALAVASAADAAAMSFDTAATVINATVKLATLGFEQGGVIPHTGLHLLHKDERVLNVKQRADYEGMMAGGAMPTSPFSEHEPGSNAGSTTHVSGGPSSHLTLNYHEGSVSALDPSTIRDVLKGSRSDLHKIVKEGIHSGAFKLRELIK